jgi:iron(III) transport system substrate-binding protein
MKRATGAVAVAAAVMAACASLAACGSSSTGSGAGTIILYNGQHLQTAENLINAFTAKTGIKVIPRNDDEDVLADQIEAEGSHSPADVFFTENSPPPQGDWVGVSARVSVIIYNPSLISASQLPTTVGQLAEARYKGKLALAPGETDFQPIVTAYDHAYGQAATLTWLKAINANAAGHIYPDNETIADNVNRGQAAFGIVNQYYWYRMRAEIGAGNMHSKITYFAAGDPGYVLDVSGAAILKSSKHQADAQRFLAFLVSKQGQEIIATPGSGPGQSLSFEYPIASGVTTNAGETPLADLKPYPITIAELGTGSTAITLMRQAGLL